MELEDGQTTARLLVMPPSPTAETVGEGQAHGTGQPAYQSTKPVKPTIDLTHSVLRFDKQQAICADESPNDRRDLS